MALLSASAELAQCGVQEEADDEDEEAAAAVAASARGHRKAGGASKAVSLLFVCRPDKLSCLCCAFDGNGQ